MPLSQTPPNLSIFMGTSFAHVLAVPWNRLNPTAYVNTHLPTCLVVDDDPQMLEMLAQFADELGYSAVKAEDGDQAWAAFQSLHPAVVISDIHMPNRNGLLLLRDIKANEPNIPVILITGWVHYKAALNMANPRPDALLEKPFALDQLRDTLERLALKLSA